MRSPSQVNGAWLVLLAAILWGTTGTSQALAPSNAQPFMIGTLRLAVGGVLLMGFALGRGVVRLAPGDWRGWPFLPTLLAALSIAAYQLCFFAGVARTGVAVGTIVGIGSSPILAGVIGFLARGERPGRVWGRATALAIAGCTLLAAAGAGIRVDPLGILLAVGAGAAYALFTVSSKTLLETHPPEAVMAAAFFSGAVLLSPLLFSADLRWLGEPAGALVILHLGGITVALAYTLFAYGLQRVPVATAATLTLAEPLTAGMLGVFFLGEKLTLQGWLGVILIFTGLVLITRSGEPRAEEQAGER